MTQCLNDSMTQCFNVSDWQAGCLFSLIHHHVEGFSLKVPTALNVSCIGA
jgi:hypothetical protein